MSDEEIDFELDWDSAIKDAVEGFSPVPPNTYRVRVTDAEAKRAASSGSPMIKVTLEIENGPHATRLLWTNLVLKPGSPGSAKMFAVKAMAFGLTAEWLAANRPTLAQTAQALIGRTADAEVVTRDYKGKPTNDVKGLKAIAGVPGVPPKAAAPSPSTTAGVPPTPTIPTVATSTPVPTLPPTVAEAPTEADMVEEVMAEIEAEAEAEIEDDAPEVPVAPEADDEVGEDEEPF